MLQLVGVFRRAPADLMVDIIAHGGKHPQSRGGSGRGAFPNQEVRSELRKGFSQNFSDLKYLFWPGNRISKLDISAGFTAYLKKG